MMGKYSANKMRSSLPVAVLIGLLLSIVVTLGGNILTAAMINSGGWSEGAYNTAAFMIWILASFAGSAVSAMLQREKFLVSSLITVAMYFLLLLSVAILFFDGQFVAIGQGILAILIGVVPTVLICRPRTKRGKVKIPYRRA